MIHRLALVLLLALSPFAVRAQAVVTVSKEVFVKQALLTVFYHELGHALIDLLDLKLYGPDEPAADIASVLLVDYLYDEALGTEMVRNGANLFIAEGIDRGEGRLAAFWDSHGTDQGRFYNTICLYYGADPKGRQAMADRLGLPEERARDCALEYASAAKSWGEVIEGLTHKAGRETFVLIATDANAPVARAAMIDEVAMLNTVLGLDVPVRIAIEPCDDPNGYYEDDTRVIVMCTEFEGYLARMYDLIAP